MYTIVVDKVRRTVFHARQPTNVNPYYLEACSARISSLFSYQEGCCGKMADSEARVEKKKVRYLGSRVKLRKSAGCSTKMK